MKTYLKQELDDVLEGGIPKGRIIGFYGNVTRPIPNLASAGQNGCLIIDIEKSVPTLDDIIARKMYELSDLKINLQNPKL